MEASVFKEGGDCLCGSRGFNVGMLACRRVEDLAAMQHMPGFAKLVCMHAEKELASSIGHCDTQYHSVKVTKTGPTAPPTCSRKRECKGKTFISSRKFVLETTKQWDVLQS